MKLADYTYIVSINYLYPLFKKINILIIYQVTAWLNLVSDMGNHYEIYFC